MRILIVGATGMLGRPVTTQLLESNHEIRLLSRNAQRARKLFPADIDIVQGDVCDRPGLAAALDGCEGIHINLRGTTTIESYERNEGLGVENIIAEAQSAGISRISYVSGAGDFSAFEHHPLLRIKAINERRIRESGIDYTIFKPTHFMESLPLFIRDGRASVIGRQPHRYHYLAAVDFAAMVSRSFRIEKAANRSLSIFGPGAFTMQQALEIYCRAVHPGLRPGSIPMTLFKFLALLKNNQEMKFAALLFEGFSEIGESGNADEANRLLGAPQTTLAEWCVTEASQACTNTVAGA